LWLMQWNLWRFYLVIRGKYQKSFLKYRHTLIISLAFSLKICTIDSASLKNQPANVGS
jgi:hypothetical protein